MCRLHLKISMKTCVLISDSKKENQTFLNILKKKFNYNLIFCAPKIESIVNVVIDNRPELLFYDMDILEIDIQTFLLQMHINLTNIPAIIGMSFSKEKAYEAFQLDFSDFILKPLSEVALKLCLSRYIKKTNQQGFKFLGLQSNKDYTYLDLKNIIYLKADNNTTDFHLNNGSQVTAYKTLKTFEKQLPNNFFRIHKSYIVNLMYVTRIQLSKSFCEVSYNNKTKIPFTKSFKENIDNIQYLLSNDTLIIKN